MTTEAGKTLIAAFVPARGDSPGSIPLRPYLVVRHAVPQIEAEAIAAERARIAEWATTQRSDTNDVSGGTYFWGYRAGWNRALEAVLAIVEDEA